MRSSIQVRVEELAQSVVRASNDDTQPVMDLIKALDMEVGDWGFTKNIKQWVDDEITNARIRGWTA